MTREQAGESTRQPMQALPGVAPGSRADYALRYAAIGWAVLPLYGIAANGRCQCGKTDCSSPGKHPMRELVPHGVHGASKDPTQLREWFTRATTANIGIAMGEPSGVVALDIDPRNGGDGLLDQLTTTHGALPDTAMALTGGGGQHYLFRYTGERVRSPGKGIDVKSTGGLIVVEPSMHASGTAYTWEASSDPLQGQPIATAPAWMLDTAPRAVNGNTPAIRSTGFLSPQRLADLQNALGYLDADDYQTWIAAGQALHSTEAPAAFALWDTWSRNSDKYRPGECDTRWRTFSAAGGLHVESIFAWARDSGWSGISTPVAVPAAEAAPTRAPATAPDVPPELLGLPGALGEVVRLANRTAPQPQPQFAVQAALALGATVIGRHARTTLNNYASLYFVNIGKSASGKEHSRTVIDTVLGAANLSHLIGPAGYSSASAVMSALLHQPSHIAIIDELGALLGTSAAEGNFHRREAINALVSAWGLLHGTLRPQAFSTMTASAQARAEMAKQIVQRPALTLLGMTTPRTFYASLGESAIEGGFLNRFIIVESHAPRSMPATAADLTVPGSIIEWCHAARDAGGGNLSNVDLSADMTPLPRVVDFDAHASRAFDVYGAACVTAMDALDSEGLAELEGRSREKALRLALILALSDNPTSPMIRAHHAEWAITYVRHYTAQMIDAVRKHMHSSRFAEWRRVALDCIIAGGERGRTEREMVQYSRLFAGLDLRQRRMVLDALAQDGAAQLVEFTSARGKKRQAWRALAPEVDE